MQSFTTALRLALLIIAVSFTTLVAGGASASPVAVVHDQVCDVTGPTCLLVVPDGSGPDFTGAHSFGGAVVDATIRVQIMGHDEHGPLGLIYLYPPEDVWLEAAEEHGQGCNGWVLTTADAPTDEEGWTMFSLPPRAGGWTAGDLQVVVGGIPATSSPYDIPTLPIAFNSPDLDGDGHVDLTDIVLFSQGIGAGDAPFRSDLTWDGVINLSDIAVFTQHIGAGCD